MQKLLTVFFVVLMLVCASTLPALADWQGTFSWTANTDPAVSGYQILMDDIVVVDGLLPADTSAVYVVPDITGQAFVLRTLGLGGEYVDSDPILAVKAPPATGGFSVEFVYQP